LVYFHVVLVAHCCDAVIMSFNAGSLGISDLIAVASNHRTVLFAAARKLAGKLTTNF